ncbi:MAG TPA: DUF4232 domain-containing protein [Ktedonobacterales bacterium]|jgi:hypothetical protein|nr:DUF4232 domain-containing protein [Ktedonobacterales bacterium]
MAQRIWRGLACALMAPLLIVALVGVAGCATSDLGGQSPQTTATSAPPTLPAATQVATRTPTPAPAASTNCQPNQLTFSVKSAGGAAGHIGQMGKFTNSSTATCTLYGFPGAVMLDAQHQPMTTHALWQTSAYMYSNQMKQLVTLAPGASAYFAVTWSDVTVGSVTSCPTSSYLSVTPPNDFSVLTIADQITSCDSNLTISPVEPTAFMGG